MCNSLILPLISRFKKQDMSVFIHIYEEFEKLIGFYAARLRYEDALSELTLFFIELLYSMDLSRFQKDGSFGVQKYIAVCIRNHYIALSRKQAAYRNFAYTFYDSCASCDEQFDDRIAFEQMLSLLTEKQKKVLIYRYKYGYSDCEIAKKLNIKRQAVNQLRNRAFAVLKTKI